MSKNRKSIKGDCKYFLGYKPCKLKKVCSSCAEYAPIEKNILIIKFAAIGDVLRTTPLLYGLKRKYPNARITWISQADACLILKNNFLIDKVLNYSLDNVLWLLSQEFDILINLDKDLRAASLANLIIAKRKLGFSLNRFGNISVFNSSAEYIFRLGVDDELKFRKNKLSYQQMNALACEIDFKNDKYILGLPKNIISKADRFWKSKGVCDSDILIGLNTGAGKVFATKVWPQEYYITLARKLSGFKNIKIALFGGPLEVKRNKEIARRLRDKIIDTGCDNTILDFAAILKRCDLLVTSDTLGMHLAISHDIPVVVLFGPTSTQEVEIYGKGVKLSSDERCSPCYKNECSFLKCMKNIAPETVLKTIVKILGLKK